LSQLSSHTVPPPWPFVSSAAIFRQPSSHVSPERPANRGVAVRPRASCLSRSPAMFPERDRSRRHAQQFHRDLVCESLRLRARRRAAQRLTSSCSLPSVYSLLFSRCRDSLRGEFTTILPRSVPYRLRRSRRHQDRGWELGLRRRICPCDSPPAFTAPATSVAWLPAGLNRTLQLCAVDQLT